MRSLRFLTGLLALTLALPGCVRPGSGRTPAAGEVQAQFAVHALPVYRLVASPTLVDTASRLVVVNLRLEATGDAGYAFALDDLRVTLPDGTPARVLDRPRAIELLRRATIAEADLAYLLRPGHQPGGIGAFTRPAVADMVAANLLVEGAFAAGVPLQGYVVVDTGTALLSIEGATFEVVAHRFGDHAAARYAFQVPPAGAAVQAQ